MPNVLNTALANLRDVAHAHPALKPGVLLRSDAPADGDDESGYAVAWPPAVVIDLRRETERHEIHPLESKATVLNLPIGGRASYVLDGDEEPINSLGELYLKMMEQPRAASIVTAITTIANADGSVLVHCTAGKDRTGVTVAATLAIAGVDREAIVADYALTNEAMSGVFQRIPRTVKNHADRPAQETIPEWLHGAPRDAIETFLDALESHQGGAAGWFIAEGGQQDAVDRLRTRLLG